MVWILALLGGYLAVGGIISPLLTMNFPQSSPSYMTPIEHVLAVVGGVVALAGAVTLFQLRRVALPLWIAALAIELLTLAHRLGANPTYRETVLAGPRAITTIAVTALTVAAIVYIDRLRRRNVLAA